MESGELTQSEGPPLVFISGPIEGFRDERREIDASLRALDVDPWVFELKSGSSQDLQESYLYYVREAERVVWIVDETTADAVEAEVRLAIKLEIPVLAFVLGEYDDTAAELLAELGNKYTPTDREGLAHAVTAVVRDELRRGFRAPKSLGGAGPPPAPPTDFTGRETELGSLRQRLAEGATVVVSGLPGVGKSALAYAVSKGADFETTLFLDLRSEARPAAVERSLRRLLVAAGHARATLPDDVDDLAALWQRTTAEGRTLVVIDDVADESEVRLLLPGGSGAALITARVDLSGLEGAEHLRLDVLPEDEATAFLATVIGAERVDSQRNDARRLIELCGGLPLALRITAARLATRPDWTLADYADRLGNERQRLETLEVGDLAVRASFNLSYALLANDESQAFRLVGHLRGPLIDAGAISAAANADRGKALEGVADAQLLTSVGGALYEVHDLLRLFAQEKLDAEERAEARRDQLVRLAEHYEAEAEKRGEAIHGGAEIEEIPLAWFDRETANIQKLCEQLVSVGESPHAAAIVFAAGALYGPAQAWREWDGILAIAEDAVEGDIGLKAKTVLNRGIAADGYGDADRADALLQEAQELARQAGNREDEARALAQRGTLRKKAGDPQEASELTGQALELYREVGDIQGEARALGDLASQADDRGEAQASIEGHRAALAAFRGLGDRHGEGLELGNLGIALMKTEALDDAADAFRAAEEIWEALGARHLLAQTFGRQGELCLRRGQLDDALAQFGRARQLFEALNDPFMVAKELGFEASTLDAMDRTDEAIAAADRALELYESVGAEFERGLVLVALFRLHGDAGDPALLEEARSIFERVPDPPHTARPDAATELAIRAIGMGRLSEGEQLLAEAIEEGRRLGVSQTLGAQLLSLAQLRAEMGESESALATRDAALRLGVELNPETLEVIERAAAAEVEVDGVSDREVRRQIERAVRIVLRAFDCPATSIRIAIGNLPEHVSGSFVVNAEEVRLSRDLLPSAGDPDFMLIFQLHVFVSQHLLMQSGVESHGDAGSYLIELFGAWFSQTQIPGLGPYAGDARPPPSPDDPYQMGALTGSALAGNARAREILEELQDEVIRGSDKSFEQTRSEWEQMTPIQVLQQLAAAYHEARNQLED